MSRNYMSVRQLLNDGDEENLDLIRSYKSDLEGMLQAFESGISELQSSTETLDDEIKSFDVLDDFFNDPQGLSNIDLYLDTIYDINQGVQLNAVTSSIALSAIGILETLKTIRGENPNFTFGVSQIEEFTDKAVVDNAALQTEILKGEAEVALSEDVRELAEQTEERHGQLLKNVSDYHEHQILRNAHVKRALSLCLTSGVYDTIELSGTIEDKEAAVRNLMNFTLECLVEQSP